MHLPESQIMYCHISLIEKQMLVLLFHKAKQHVKSKLN